MEERNHETFRKLYLAYSEKIINLALRLTGNRTDAQNIAQDVFKSYFILMQKVNNPLPWLMETTYNKVLNYWKAKGRKKEDPLDDGGAELVAPKQEELDFFEDNLPHWLDETDRQIIVLRFKYSYNSREIADELGIVHGTCRTKLFRILAKMKEDKEFIESLKSM